MNAPAPTDAYLICGTPRTGSTLLCSLLRSTGVAGRPESYFRVPGEKLWASRWGLTANADGAVDRASFMRAAAAAGATPNGVFGARIMWGTMDDLIARLEVTHPGPRRPPVDLLADAFGRPRFIHLTRDDIVAQAVSWARAEQTNHWQDTDGTDGRPEFDRDLIDTLVATIREHDAAWRAWFGSNDVQPHPVRYEALVADPGAW